MTGLLIIAVEAARALGIHVHGLGAVLLVTVSFAVLSGGAVVGVVSGAIGLAYIAYYHAEPGTRLTYSADNVQRLVTDLVTAVIVLALLASINQRLARQASIERNLRAEAESGRERLRMILESITDGFFSVNREWRYTYVNAQAERIVGKRREELLDVAIWEAFPELRGSAWDREYHRAMETGAPVHFEAFYTPLSSWFETHGYPSEEGLTIYLRPINDRKRAEQLLRARITQQAAVATLGQLALQQTDLDHLFGATVRSISEVLDADLVKILELLPDRSALRLRAGVGWAEGLVGSALVETDHDSQAGYTLNSRTRVIVDDLSAEKRFRAPKLLVDHRVKSGMSVTIEGSSAPFGVLGVHTRQPRAFTQDDADFLCAVSQLLAQAIERKNMSSSLAEREALFRDLAENINEVLFVAEPGGAIVSYVSPAYERLWGRPRAQALAQPLAWLDAVHPEDRPRVGVALEGLARTGSLREEFRIVRPDGSERWVLDRAFSVLDETGKVIRVVGLVQDMTARRQADESARQLAEERVSRAAAEAAVRARDEILAVISHELRGPLSTITVAAQAMDIEKTSARFAPQLGRAAKQMTRLVNDLLDVSRMDARRLTVDLKPFDVGHLVSEVCDHMAPAASEKGIVLSVRVDPELPVAADWVRMYQVLRNLIDNALKFTPSGGAITVVGKSVDSEVHVSVSDTGCGIPSEGIPHLFERFWQGSQFDRRGVGLGLSIVKGILDAHGGRVWVESRPGQGTTFHVALSRNLASAIGKSHMIREASSPRSRTTEG